jgi:hypothetical protein
MCAVVQLSITRTALKEAAALWKKLLAGVAVLLVILVALAWYLHAFSGTVLICEDILRTIPLL